MPQSKITVTKTAIKLPAKLMQLVEHKLPADKEIITIDLFAPVCIANAFRRCLINEIPVNVLTAKIEDVFTDCSVPNDCIINRLESIPIYQHSKLKGSFMYKNTTDELVTIYNTDLELTTDNKSNYKFEDVYVLTKLRAGKTLKIENITTSITYGGTAIPVENMIYREIDSDKHYYLSFNTVGIYKSGELVKVMFDTLLGRLTRIKDAIKEITEPTITDNIEYSVLNDDINILKIFNENITITNIIVYMCFEFDKGVTLINTNISHITENDVLIKWRHKDKLRYIVAGIEAGLSVLTKLSTELKL